MECRRLGEKCFGAVGFRNSVSDSPDDKKSIKKKFRDDVLAARAADGAIRALVFFTNVDLRPSEVKVLERFAHGHGFTFVDIYMRERIRMALDAPEGLSTRYQMLSIELSSAEQAAFFSRFGRELEDLVRGRFDRLEKKLDAIEFSQWKTGCIRSLQLDLTFHNYIESAHDAPEHFRVALELQSDLSTGHRGMTLGCRDAFWPTGRGRFYFGTKAFYWREACGSIEDSWVECPVQAGGGLVGGVRVHLNWHPVSSILAVEFDGLIPTLHLTENLVERIRSVRFAIDDYVFIDDGFSVDDVESYRPSLGWPEELSEEEGRMWCSGRLGWSIDFRRHTAKLAGDSAQQSG